MPTQWSKCWTFAHEVECPWFESRLWDLECSLLRSSILGQNGLLILSGFLYWSNFNRPLKLTTIPTKLPFLIIIIFFIKDKNIFSIHTSYSICVETHLSNEACKLSNYTFRYFTNWNDRQINIENRVFYSWISTMHTYI